MVEKYSYITTPIYYVNDKPHIGHMYTSLAADIYNRFKKLDGYNTIFATGTDEHGQKILKKAEEQDITPQQLVNNISKTFAELTPLLNLSNTDFVRTTEHKHKLAVQHLWQVLEEKGFIYLDKYSGWYAIRDEAYYNEDELTTGKQGEKIAPSGAVAEWKEESSYFFKMSALQEKLLAYYSKHSNFIAPKSRYNEIKSFVKSGLKDISISRSSFHWGIPVPKDSQHIVYVWLDALTNYLSVLGYPDTNSEKYKHYWQEAVHLVGKDIIRFHGVYWPAFLLAAELPLPKRIFAHGWWLNEGEKISKSLGNVISPNTLIKKYGLDQTRYFLFKEITFGNDGNFSHQAMVSRINNELANEYGNLLQRSSALVNKHFKGILNNEGLSATHRKFLNSFNSLLKNELTTLIDQQDFSTYLEKIWEKIRYANSYINRHAPWNLIKIGNKEGAALELYFIMEIIRRVTILLQPFIPNATANIFQQLNIPEEKRCFSYLNKYLTKGHKINPPEPIFLKYQEEEV
ncbi:Methionine--tRNA ligase [Candidatus Hepatincola sp. Av]